MGCDIHGVWECKLPNDVWVVFRGINEGRDYEWFGILSGVRREGPRCDSWEWDPRKRQNDAGSYWLRACELDGDRLHNHTLVTIPALRQANEEWHRTRCEWNPRQEEVDNHELEPDLDDLVEEIWVGASDPNEEWAPVRPNVIPMRIPLRDVMGLEPDTRIDDVFDRVRMVIAYDS